MTSVKENFVEITSDYLKQNKDIEKFLKFASDNAGRLVPVWIENLRKNRDFFKQCGWAIPRLQDCEEGKTAIIMGASPAIRNQIETLQGIQYDKDFVLCGISSNLEFLLNNGIYPKYCIVVDADKSTGEDWDNVDMDKTKDITLITNLFTYPPMLRKWKGPLYFLGLDTDDKPMKAKQEKWYPNMNGTGQAFPALVAQFNMMVAFAFLVLRCNILLFVGHELSFQEKEAKYYVDRDDPRDKDARHPHGDIHGNIVQTTSSLCAVKYCLEGYLELIEGAGWFINCTEAGIFGISKRFPDWHLPWIQQLTLKSGIAQARQIMRTGEPFYTHEDGSVVRVPDLQARVNFSL